MTNAEATWHDTMLIVANAGIKRLAASRFADDREEAVVMQAMLDAAYAGVAAEHTEIDRKFSDPLSDPVLREMSRMGREIHLAVNAR